MYHLIIGFVGIELACAIPMLYERFKKPKQKQQYNDNMDEYWIDDYIKLTKLH